MNVIKTEVLNALQGLKGSGEFVSKGAVPFVLPGLCIEGEQEVSFPITEEQCKVLIDSAIQAPFGKGTDTIVDTSVRKTCEIDSERIRFRNPQWDVTLDSILDKVKKDLGLVEMLYLIIKEYKQIEQKWND